MPSLNDTAYPRLKTNPTAKELAEVYTPNPAEIAFADENTRRLTPKLGFLIYLKTFQRLGYFISIDLIPAAIVNHVANSLDMTNTIKKLDRYESTSARKSHMKLIRTFLGVTANGPESQAVMEQASIEAAKTKDDLADIVNVTIEELIRQHYELPAFSSLLKQAKKAKTKVNRNYHRILYDSLGDIGREQIDALFAGGSRKIKSMWDKVKMEPKSPTVANMKEFISHLEWLRQHDLPSEKFSVIPDVKLRQFAAEARALDAASMKDLVENKRYALAAALIRAQAMRGVDDLAEMFVKRVAKLHRLGKEALAQYHHNQAEQTYPLISMLQDIVVAVYKGDNNEIDRLEVVKDIIGNESDKIIEFCEAYRVYACGNFLPFLPRLYTGVRSTLFTLLDNLTLVTTNSDLSVERAMHFLLENRKTRGDWLSISDGTTQLIDISWVPANWWPFVTNKAKHDAPVLQVARRYFELCVFSQIMWDLKSGDLAAIGGDNFSDYRAQLVSWQEYDREVKLYCDQVGIDSDATTFIEKMKKSLEEAADVMDKSFLSNESLRIENGEPILSRIERKALPEGSKALDKLISERITPVNIVDVLADTDHWLNWTSGFGPLSGHDAKLNNPRERYIITTFCYGCNLGPTQTARSIKGLDRRQVSIINQRHLTEDKLDEAIAKVVNAYKSFSLPKIWGSGKTASADGTKWDLYEQNLLSEYHIRYGGYGGIGYYHVSDTYIALFSRFIPCGVWEAVHILDGLLQNRSDIQPDTLHGDTQAQSAPVFALSHLLGIKLMPRIRNWKDLTFVRPSKSAYYEHIDSLFSDVVDWHLIETHLPDMLRIAISIKAGNITSAIILRRLGTSSRKSRLYFAFKELGIVIRTIFLLNYIRDPDLRRTIQVATNKSESFNGFTQWVAFGGNGVIAENSREEQRKVIKYNHLVSNLVVVHNVHNITCVLRDLAQEGYLIDPQTLAVLSPYRMEHINRFGDYTLNLERTPTPLTYHFYDFH